MAYSADASAALRGSVPDMMDEHKRYSYTSTASFPFMGPRPSMECILGNEFSRVQDSTKVPSLAERLQSIIAPFFLEMQQSLQNFVEIEIRAELERARRQLPTQKQDLDPDHQRYNRRSTSEERSFSGGPQIGPTVRRSSIPLPKMAEEIAEQCVLSTQPPTPTHETQGLSGTLPFPTSSSRSAGRQRDNLNQDSANSLRMPFRFDQADPISIPRMSSLAPGGHEGEGEQQDLPVCRHWHSKGWCRLGDGCKFTHPDDARGIGQLPAKHRARKEANSSPDNSGQAAADAAAPGNARPRKVPGS